MKVTIDTHLLGTNRSLDLHKNVHQDLIAAAAAIDKAIVPAAKRLRQEFGNKLQALSFCFQVRRQLVSEVEVALRIDENKVATGVICLSDKLIASGETTDIDVYAAVMKIFCQYILGEQSEDT